MNSVFTDKEVVLSVIGAIMLAMQLYSSYKQRQLDVRTKRTEESVQENKQLLRENTQATREIVKQTDGMTAKLIDAVRSTSYAVGKLKSSGDLEDESQRQALDELAAEFAKGREERKNEEALTKQQANLEK